MVGGDNMIKINDNKYVEYNTKISWIDFERNSNNAEIVWGKAGHNLNAKNDETAPFIEFNINNNILIGLEFSLSSKMLSEFPLNKQIDVSQYLSDITYEDEKGWISLITWDYKCTITKTAKNEYKLQFNILSNEIEKLDIKIDTNLKI